jgi:exopolysaccharide biosynthesis polyprenyl glycosylphosphotransferase
LGYNEQVKELAKIIKERPQLGFNIALIAQKEEINNLDIKKIIKDKHINTIILTSDINDSPRLRHQLFSSLALKINIINLPKFYEYITGKIPIEAISQMWFLQNLSEGSKKWFDTVKRFYDIIFSILIIIGTFPFCLIIGLIIKKESPGPIFFTQIRSGKNNKNFIVIKFRTMTTTNNDHSPTVGGDKRITKFGNFLRKTRLDEIPQVINILFGDMSLVGPRPERPEYIAELKEAIPFYEERMLVKPGLTGTDQISGEYHSPSKEDTLKKLQYDLFYIKNRSIYLDLSIILKTIATVFSKGGM